MKNTQYEYMIHGLRRQVDLAQKAGHRPVISRGRQIEANIDWDQLPMLRSEKLTDEDGVPFFMPGYSRVGGSDRVRPTDP